MRIVNYLSTTNAPNGTPRRGSHVINTETGERDFIIGTVSVLVQWATANNVEYVMAGSYVITPQQYDVIFQQDRI